MNNAYPYALQLYSVRDYFERQLEDAFLLVKNAGYRYVETAGDYGLSVSELKRMLDTSDLIPISMHAGYDQVIGNLATIINQAKALQISYIVISWLGKEICPARNDWVMAAEAMNQAGALIREEGMQLCYHNHNHEFELAGDESYFEVIFNNSSEENLKIELDLCWATVGKADIYTLLDKYHDRTPLVHVKDCKSFSDDELIVFTELGKGLLNWQKILPAALAAGTRWFIVEQDASERDSLESATVNAAYMQEFNRKQL
jgi:sugar phosphate isomerase/epimerase